MKFFLDTANLDDIAFGVESGLLDGVTTNPSLIAKEGKRHHDQLAAICEIVNGPVSAEVLATDYEGMVEEGRTLAGLAPNIVVKIPIGLDGLRAIRTLHDEGIRSNTTLIFSALQALMAAKAGTSYVSPFVGRLDDIGHEGMGMVSQMVQIFDNYAFDCEILVASIRSPNHLLESAMLGAHVATLPRKVFGQIVKHPLTDIGLEKFLADAKATPK